jgi:hypothetical protein
MSFKKMLLYPIEHWMRPVLLSFISMPVLAIGMLANIELLSAVGGLFFLGSLALLCISFFYLLLKREWQKALYTLVFLFTIATIIGLLN